MRNDVLSALLAVFSATFPFSPNPPPLQPFKCTPLLRSFHPLLSTSGLNHTSSTLWFQWARSQWGFTLSLCFKLGVREIGRVMRPEFPTSFFLAKMETRCGSLSIWGNLIRMCACVRETGLVRDLRRWYMCVERLK